ncbi:MAG: aerotolerance regulator BatB [Gemmatales bacterium]|nr:MAG: aerotolerance regulator BatB [Gemmatales bacterium]
MTKIERMLSLYFAHPEILWWLLVLPGLWLLSWYARRQKRKTLSLLGDRAALAGLTLGQAWRRRVRHVCLSLCCAVAIIASAGPQWGLAEPRVAAGRDIVVVLDMSRSMLASDVLPSRLGHCQKALHELVRAVERRGGHRLGLIVFAGQARVVCPLTPDYHHFQSAADELQAPDPRLVPSAQPGQMPSGTRIGTALQLAVSIHDPRYQGHQDILLLSDGDDPAGDQEWQVGVDAARTARIPVYTVGVGDPDDDSQILDNEGRPLVYDGQPIATRLREAVLEEIAAATGGIYTPARTNLIPLEELFHVYIEPGPGRELEGDRLPAFQQRYAWFFAVALAFFLMSVLIADRGKPKKSKDNKTSGISDLPQRLQRVTRVGAVWLAIALLFLVSAAAPKSDWLDLVRAGNQAFSRGEFARAVAFYSQAEPVALDPGLVSFNKAAALYRLGKYFDAERHYLRCLEEAPRVRRRRILFNVGNCILKQLPDEIQRIDEAIACYEECIRLSNDDQDLQSSAIHNLKLARQLRKEIESRPPDKPPDKEKPPGPNHTPKEKSGKDGTTTKKTGNKRSDPKETNKQPVKDKNEKDGIESQTDQPTPGSGDLPPIADTDEPLDLSRRDALAHLERVNELIRRQQREFYKRTLKLPAGVKDW